MSWGVLQVVSDHELGSVTHQGRFLAISWEVLLTRGGF